MLYYDVVEQGNYALCLSEKADDNLSRIIYNCKNTRSLLPPDEILNIARQLVKGLMILHSEHILHGSIKASNILVMKK